MLKMFAIVVLVPPTTNRKKGTMNACTTTSTAKVTVRAIPTPNGEVAVTVDGVTYRVYRADILVASKGDEWDDIAHGEGNWFHPDNIAESLRWTSRKALPADFGARILAALDRSVQRYQAAALAK